MDPDLTWLSLQAHQVSSAASIHLPSSHNNVDEPNALLLVSSAGTHRTEHVVDELVRFQGGRIVPRRF